MPRRLGDDDWESLPDDVRDRLADAGLERSWRGLGGPDVPAMRDILDEGDWDRHIQGGDQLTWDTAVALDAWGIDPETFDSITGYVVDYQDGHWYGTIAYDDERTVRIDFGVDSDSVWDVYEYLQIWYDVEVERGDIDYDEK